MTTQLHLAHGIVAGRIHQTQDPAVLRNVALARQDAKKARRRA